MSKLRNVVFAALVGIVPVALSGAAFAGAHGNSGAAAQPQPHPQVSEGASAAGRGMGAMDMQGQGAMGMHGQGGMMGGDMRCAGMMASGMAHQNVMMGPGAEFNVRPIQHLAVEDVRHFFDHRLADAGNTRVKLGNLEMVDDDWIVVEIVTIDDSLIERLKIDRHSGAVSRDE